MSLENLVAAIKRSTHSRHIYHFTDKSNVPLMRQHGLLSKNAMRGKGIWPPPRPSGNQWSWDEDDRLGISDYVSLAMTRNHPMSYAAKKDGRIADPIYIGIAPDILLKEGVLFAADIANKAGVARVPLRDAVENIDVEVLYAWTDWRKSEIKERLRAAKRYEILVPQGIGLEMIKKVWK